MRVLVSVFDKLGDLLVATPVFAALRAAGHEVTVSTPERWHDALRFNDDVTAVRPDFFRPSVGERLAWAREMRREGYGALVCLSEHTSGHILPAYLARVPRRVGRTDKWYGRLLTANLWGEWDARTDHVVERKLWAAETAVGASLPRLPMRLPFREEHREEAARLAPAGGYFVVHPGTGGSARRYDGARYAEAARRVAAGSGLVPVVTGGPSEVELAGEVAAACGGVAVAGATSVHVLAALVAGARLVVAGGTGVLHVAATQRTPAVLVEPTSGSHLRAEVWRPWMTPSRLVVADRVCAGCTAVECHQRGTDCVESIPPAAVAAAGLELLG